VWLARLSLQTPVEDLPRTLEPDGGTGLPHQADRRRRRGLDRYGYPSSPCRWGMIALVPLWLVSGVEGTDRPSLAIPLAQCCHGDASGNADAGSANAIPGSTQKVAHRNHQSSLLSVGRISVVPV